MDRQKIVAELMKEAARHRAVAAGLEKAAGILGGDGKKPRRQAFALAAAQQVSVVERRLRSSGGAGA